MLNKEGLQIFFVGHYSESLDFSKNISENCQFFKKNEQKGLRNAKSFQLVSEIS